MSAMMTGAELICRWRTNRYRPGIARLEKELAALNSEVERVEKKLGNEGYIAKAPAHVVEQERARATITATSDKVLARIAGCGDDGGMATMNDQQSEIQPAFRTAAEAIAWITGLMPTVGIRPGLGEWNCCSS
uniref:hypothetical protein n=1 Tax=Cohnella faecalis TaxID=2315694 RepID=UPI003988CD3C